MLCTHQSKHSSEWKRKNYFQIEEKSKSEVLIFFPLLILFRSSFAFRFYFIRLFYEKLQRQIWFCNWKLFNVVLGTLLRISLKMDQFFRSFLFPFSFSISFSNSKETIQLLSKWNVNEIKEFIKFMLHCQFKNKKSVWKSMRKAKKVE